MVKLMRKWKECGQEECEQDATWCANIDDMTMVDGVIPGMQWLMKRAVEDNFFAPESIELVLSVLESFGSHLSESVANKLDKCTVPLVDHHSDASMHGNISCDIAKQSYLRATTKTSFNSTTMMSLVFVVFGCFVVLVGDFESFHFHLSLVRVGCCGVGLLMSSLVYVGSWHLYQSSIDNPLQSDADLQITWRAIYLLISYMCLHGGLLVVVPNVGGAGIVVGTKSKPSATVDQDRTCCRRGSTCFKMVYFLKDFKEQFWDASGE
jgi:hypothetical protein